MSVREVGLHWRRGSRSSGQDVGEQWARRGGGGVWAMLNLDVGDQKDGVHFMDLEIGRRSRLGWGRVIGCRWLW